MKTKTQKQLIVVSIVSFVVTVFLLTSSIFAWISISKKANGSFIVNTTDISSDSEFYLYKDSAFAGSGTKLISDECTAPGEEQCFQKIINPQVSQIISPDIKPSDRMSFALKIVNLSSVNTTLRLSFGGIVSIGFNEEYNKIQRAFLYEITGIRYLNSGIEGNDIKASADTTSMHFHNNELSRYILLEDFELKKNGSENDRAVIYFDLYYDENIYGMDELLVSTGNSNAFMNQTFIIEKFYIELDR